MGIITRIGAAPGVRRLVHRHETPAEVRENPDDEDRTPLWCADCRREILFEQPRCADCGGEAVSTEELARRMHARPPAAGRGPADW